MQLHYVASSLHSRLSLRVSTCNTSVLMALLGLGVELVGSGHANAMVHHPLSFDHGHPPPPPFD